MSDWVKSVDPGSGRDLWVNHKTRETSWSAPQVLQPLPSNWEERRDDQGRVFYIDHDTRTTTWIDPRLTAASQPAAAAVTTPTPDAFGGLSAEELEEQRRAYEQFAVPSRPPVAPQASGGGANFPDTSNDEALAALLAQGIDPFANDGPSASTAGGGGPPDHPQLVRQASAIAPFRVPDAQRKACLKSGLPFVPIQRPRHHCRSCGEIFSDQHSDHRAHMPFAGENPTDKEQRVCDWCWEYIERGSFGIPGRFITMIKFSDAPRPDRVESVTALAETLQKRSVSPADLARDMDRYGGPTPLLAGFADLLTVGAEGGSTDGRLGAVAEGLATLVDHVSGLNPSAYASPEAPDEDFREIFFEAAVEAGIMDLAVSLLSPPGGVAPSPVEPASQLLFFLTQYRPLRDLVERSHGLGPFLDLLTDPNTGTQMWIAATMWGLLDSNPSGAKLLVDRGGVFLLCTLLSLGPEQESVMAHAIHALSAALGALLHPPTPGSRDRNTDAADAGVEARGEEPTRDERHAARDRFVSEVLTHGAVGAALSLMHAGDAKRVSVTAKFLRLLAGQKDVASALHREGALTLASRALAQGAGSASLKVDLLRILGVVVAGTDRRPHAAKEAIDAGVLDAAVPLLRAPEPSLRASAAHLVAELAQDGIQGPVVAAAPGLYEALEKQLMDPSMAQANPSASVDPDPTLPLYHAALAGVAKVVAWEGRYAGSAGGAGTIGLAAMQSGMWTFAESLLQAQNPKSQASAAEVIHGLASHGDATVRGLVHASITPDAPLMTTLGNVAATTLEIHLGGGAEEGQRLIEVTQACLLALGSLAGGVPMVRGEDPTQWMMSVGVGTSADDAMAEAFREAAYRAGALATALRSLDVTKDGSETELQIAALRFLEVLCRPPPPPATQSASSALSARCRSALDLHAASYVVDLLHDAASSSHPLRALLGLRAFADLAPYMSRTAPELKQGLGAVSRLLMPQSDSAQPDPGRMRLSLEAMSVVQMLSNTMDPPPDLSGILPAMIEMLFMDKHLSDPSVNSVTLATGVLRVLAKMVQNPDQAQMVVDQGGVFPLASLLRKARDALMTGTEDETGDWAGQGSVGCLLEACLECLRSLVRSPREDIRERVMQTGEMGVLLVLVDDAVLQLGLTSVPARAADAAAKTQWEVVVLWTLQTLEALLSDTRAQLHPEALLVSSISPSTGRSQRKVPNPNPKASNYTDREGSPLDSIAELCIPRAESALLSPKSDAPKDADPRAALLALATSQAQLLLRRLGAVTADPGAAARFWGTLVSGGHLFALLALLATPWATEGGAASPFPNATVAALKSGASAALVEMVSWGTETETWNSLGVDLLLKNLKTSVNAARVVQTLCARPPVQARILGEAPLLTPLVESFFDQNLARVAMEALAAVVRSEELPDEKAILFAKGLHATGLRPKLLRSLAAAVTAGHQPEPRATSLLLAVLAGMEAGAAASPTPTEAFGLPDAEAEIFAKNPEFFRRLLRLHATGMQPGQNRTGSALVEQQRLRQSLSLLLSAPAVVPAVTQAGFDLKKALQQGTNPLDRALGLSLLRALLHSSDSAAQSTLSQTVPAVIALTTQSLDALATQRHVAEEDLRVAETAAQVLVAMVRTPENTFSGPYATEAADDVAFLDAPNGLRAFFRPLSSLAERVRNGPGDAESAGHAANGATANGAADASEPNLLLGDAVPAVTPQATGLGDAADADPKAADDLLLRLVPRTLAATLHLVSAAQPARYREAVLAAVPEPLLQLLDTLSSGTFDNYFPEHPALPELLLLLVHTTTVLASVPTAEGRGHQHSLWVAVAKMAEFVVTRSHTPTPPDWKLSHIVEIRQILWQNLAMGAGRGDFGVQVRSVATAAIRGVLDDLMSPSVKKERALWFELRSALTLLERVERLKVSPSAASVAATDVEVAVPEGTSLLNADLAELSGPAAAPARSGTPADRSPALSTEAVAAILDALHVAVAAIAKAAPADAIEARTGAVEQLLRLVADVAADGVTRDAEASTSESASPAAQLRDGIWNAPQTLDGLRAAALHEKRSTLPETLQCVCAQIVHLLDLADPHLGAANASPELRANLLYFAQLLPPGATRLLGPALGLAPTPSSAQDGADHPGLALDAPAALVDPFAHDQASATALEAALDAARTPFGVVEASPAPVPAAHTSYNYAQAPQGPPPKPAPAPAPPAAAFDPFRGFGAAAAAAAATATPENAGVPPSYGALMGGEKSGTEAPPSYGNLF